MGVSYCFCYTSKIDLGIERVQTVYGHNLSKGFHYGDVSSSLIRITMQLGLLI